MTMCTVISHVCQSFLLFEHLERDQCSKSGSIPKKWGWTDSPQPSSNLTYSDTPLWTSKCIFPSQANLASSSTCLFHVLFGLHFFLWPSTSKCPSQDMTILSPKHMNIPTHTACHGKLIHSFIKTQHDIKSVDLFLSLSCTPHIALTMDLSIIF